MTAQTPTISTASKYASKPRPVRPVVLGAGPLAALSLRAALFAAAPGRADHSDEFRVVGRHQIVRAALKWRATSRTPARGCGPSPTAIASSRRRAKYAGPWVGAVRHPTPQWPAAHTQESSSTWLLRTGWQRADPLPSGPMQGPRLAAGPRHDTPCPAAFLDAAAMAADARAGSKRFFHLLARSTCSGTGQRRSCYRTPIDRNRVPAEPQAAWSCRSGLSSFGRPC